MSSIQQKGLTYERKVHKDFRAMFKHQGEILHGPWYNFVDAQGEGNCSPDIIQIRKDRVILLECKLSFTMIGISQLKHKYVPIIEHYYKRKAVPLLVSKNIGKGFNSFSAVCWEDIDQIEPGQEPAWLHHLP